MWTQEAGRAGSDSRVCRRWDPTQGRAGGPGAVEMPCANEPAVSTEERFEVLSG